jgi:hypothetical protein
MELSSSLRLWGGGGSHFNVSQRPLMASSCNTNGSVTELCAHTIAGTFGDAAEGFLPGVMCTQALPTQAIATHAVVDIAALYVTPTRNKRLQGYVGLCQ